MAVCLVGLGRRVDARAREARHALAAARRRQPRLAPDILFRSNVDVDDERSQYYTVRPDGTGLTRLTHFRFTHRRLFSATFSPDGMGVTGWRGGIPVHDRVPPGGVPTLSEPECAGSRARRDTETMYT